MTSISATSYASYYPTLTTSTATSTTATPSSTSSSSGSATTITLSDAAKAAMSLPDFTTVITSARAALDSLTADGTTPANADLSQLDRRQLFAISSNAQSQFSPDEQAAATTEQQNRLDAALSGPLAVARVTDDVAGIYTAAQTFLDGASAEEKATQTWIDQKAALTQAQKQLAANPTQAPQVSGDIVAAYVQSATAGDDTGTLRDFSAVASDARAALDAQYAAATAAGKQLVFNPAQKSGQLVDFSQFDSRSLSAVALDQDDKFSPDEVSAAKQVIAQRSSATILAGLQNASSSDPGSFAQNLISAYGSMSPEERQAAGWSDQFYAAAVASYQSASQLANLFGSSGSSTSAPSSGSLALDLLNNGSSSGSGNTSLMDILSGSSGTAAASSTGSSALDLLNSGSGSNTSGADDGMSLVDYLGS